VKEEFKPEIEKFMSPAKEGKRNILSVMSSPIQVEAFKVEDRKQLIFLLLLLVRVQFTRIQTPHLCQQSTKGNINKQKCKTVRNNIIQTVKGKVSSRTIWHL
jgi:hypothetical protein